MHAGARDPGGERVVIGDLRRRQLNEVAHDPAGARLEAARPRDAQELAAIRLAQAQGDDFRRAMAGA